MPSVPELYYGAGAGAEPTASAVVADLVDVVRTLHTADPEHRVPHLAFQPDALSDLPVLPMAESVETCLLPAFAGRTTAPACWPT
jgi:homoserine dehydrogenase